jgi:hypothetical protein
MANQQSAASEHLERRYLIIAHGGSERDVFTYAAGADVWRQKITR